MEVWKYAPKKKKTKNPGNKERTGFQKALTPQL